MPTLNDVSRTVAIRAAIIDFSDRVLADPALAPRFEGHDAARIRAHHRAFANVALGCADLYINRSPGGADSAFRLTEAEFSATADHLAASLCAAGIGGELAAALTARLGPLRHQLVRPS